MRHSGAEFQHTFPSCTYKLPAYKNRYKETDTIHFLLNITNTGPNVESLFYSGGLEITTVFSGNVLKFHILEGQIAQMIILCFFSWASICTLLLSVRDPLHT